MKTDIFEDIFPGLAVYDNETSQLVVSLDNRELIIRVAKDEEGAINWWSVLPADMIEQNCDMLGFNQPVTDRLRDMIRGAELITDSASAKTAVRDYVYEEIWSKARRDETLIEDA